MPYRPWPIRLAIVPKLSLGIGSGGRIQLAGLDASRRLGDCELVGVLRLALAL